MDSQTAHRLRVQLAEQLRQQLTIGAPTNADERTLRQPTPQLRAKKVIVKLFLRHPLHAKLYLFFRNDPISPIVAYLGSSIPTFAGLSAQDELNVAVLGQDARVKLKQWFEDRWNDRLCVAIANELLQITEDRWAREALIPPGPRLSQNGLTSIPRSPRRPRRGCPPAPPNRRTASGRGRRAVVVRRSPCVERSRIE